METHGESKIEYIIILSINYKYKNEENHNISISHLFFISVDRMFVFLDRNSVACILLLIY